MKKILATVVSAALVLSMVPLAFATDVLSGSGSEEDPITEATFVEFEGVAESGVAVSVTAPEGAFSNDAEMSVSDVDVPLDQVSDVVSEESDGDILGLSAVDINFMEQPSETVSVNIKVPVAEVPEGAKEAVIVHMTEDGPEVVGTVSLTSDGECHSLSFTTDGFSSYAAVFVGGKYQSKKLRDVLAANEAYASRYSITSFSVDLFDYDPAKINAALNAATSDGKGFHFTGYGIDGCGSNNGINNSTAEFAKQGILANELSNGLPVVKYLNGDGAGAETGAILFGDTKASEGKVIYKDIPFEFVYDNVSGWYEYKSSANHAQLSDDNTKIEMYADTLSTQNKYVGANLDLSTATGLSDITTISAEKSLYKGTASDTGGTVGRLDPYVVFPVEDVDASTVSGIYVKAKVPASVGTNNFQLFFTTAQSTSWEEAKSYYTVTNTTHYGELQYTPNGEYVEFVVDTSTNSAWTGDVTAVRIDLFDSNKGTVPVGGSYPIEIAQISFIQKGYNEYATRGGFYPFSDIRDSYPGNNPGFELDEWAAHMQETSATTSLATRSMGNSALSTANLNAKLAYGVAMEFDFYIPVGGQVDWGNGNGLEDLVYYFNGDDDLWVFVDGKLVLDIGGGHGAILGTANFTTGDVMVENAVKVDGYNSGATSTAGQKTGKMDASLYTPGKHTMKVFYLERGGSVSNCYMKFNLPQTPAGDLTVSKETVGLDQSILDAEVFEFTMTAKDLGSGSTTGGQAVAWGNQSYYVVDLATGTVVDNPASSDGAFKTSASGVLSLKSGQEARFTFAENYEVTVAETPKAVAGYEHVQTKANGNLGVSGESLYTLTQVTADKAKRSYVFENTYRELESTFTYVPVNPADCPEGKKGTVELTGTPASATCLPEGVSETVGKRVGDPVGSTAAVAADSPAVEFVGWYSDAACTTLVSSNPAFDPAKDGALVWEKDTYTYYAKFEYMYGDLKISKSGIKAVDNHEAAANSNAEWQSTLYTVSGTSNSGKAISVSVSVHGNDSIVVKDLPVGTYTVEEDADWAWRYTPEQKSIQVVVEPDKSVSASFANSRTADKWLGGDNYKTNPFTANAKNAE